MRNRTGLAHQHESPAQIAKEAKAEAPTMSEGKPSTR